MLNLSTQTHNKSLSVHACTSWSHFLIVTFQMRHHGSELVQKGRGKFVDLGQHQNGFLTAVFSKTAVCHRSVSVFLWISLYQVSKYALLPLKGSGVGKAVFAAALLHQWSSYPFSPMIVWLSPNGILLNKCKVISSWHRISPKFKWKVIYIDPCMYLAASDGMKIISKGNTNWNIRLSCISLPSVLSWFC